MIYYQINLQIYNIFHRSLTETPIAYLYHKLNVDEYTSLKRLHASIFITGDDNLSNLLWV